MNFSYPLFVLLPSFILIIVGVVMRVMRAARRARRDYFAAKAMQSIVIRFGGSASIGNDHDGSLTHAAKEAYAMADAMLKARSA